MIRLAIGLALGLLSALPGVAQFAPQAPPPEVAPERGDPSVKLPLPEARSPVDPGRVAVVRGGNLSWQLISGSKLLRDYGQDFQTADDLMRAVRDLRATEWVTLGFPEPVVEYGLTDGRAAVGAPRSARAIVLDGTTRLEQLRGVWVLRTDTAIVANFGADRASAEQAIAVVKRYGFNRAAALGPQARSGFLYHSATRAGEPPAPSRLQALAVASIGETLSRTGVQIPGTDEYAGERVVFDPRGLELKQDGSQFVLKSGAVVLGSFGRDEWAGRDALNAARDGRFTEVCKVAGATFYLSNGQPPSHYGLGTRRTNFETASLVVRPEGDRFVLMDARGARALEAATRADADLLLRVVKGYGFDAVCECGGGRTGGLTYLARTGR